MGSLSARGLGALGLCLLSLLLAACGGGGDSSSTTAGLVASAPAPTTTRPSSSPARSHPSHRRSAHPSAKSRKADASSGTHRHAEAGSHGTPEETGRPSSAGRHRSKGRPASASASDAGAERVTVPPISSAPKAGSTKPAPGVATVKGGDNSVQEYGVEAGESGRREAAIALQAYLNDRAEGDWASACAALGRKATQQLEEAAKSLSAQGTEASGCPATMATLSEGPAKLSEEATITEVLSFRGGGEIAGDPSYLIFSGPPSKALYSMPMYMEDGGWKIGLLSAVQLQS